jgi:hypothetical protein
MPVVVAIRLEGGEGHRHIVAMSCRDHGDPRTRRSPVGELMAFVRAGGDLRCRHWRGEGRVRVDRSGGLPVLRAWRDGGFTDDLLELPRFEEPATAGDAVRSLGARVARWLGGAPPGARPGR